MELDPDYDPLEIHRQKKQFMKDNLKKILTRLDKPEIDDDEEEAVSPEAASPDVSNFRKAVQRTTKTHKFINKLKVGQLMKM